MKNIFAVTFLLIMLFSFNNGKAQNYKRLDSINVTVNNKVLKNAWAGGLNCAEFSAVDLNNDGIKDFLNIRFLS
jgi:hypothetical protein